MEIKRYFIELSYNGTAYHGWQRQPNAMSIQQLLEEALSKILGETIRIVGAGRTDTGVHARQMFAHFDLKKKTIDPNEIVFLLNAFLPKDIAVRSIHSVTAQAHARFDATARSYEYHIATQKDPFFSDFHYYIKNAPNVLSMNEAAKTLLEYKDFQCFSRSNTDVKTFICKIEKAEWHQEGSRLVFYISANRFLRNMVRAIVGTLLEIGQNKRAMEDFEQVIKSKDRKQAGFSVPAQGLYLTKIEYPSNIFMD